MGRRLAVLGGLGVATFALLPAAAAGAHPLGNFTTNQYVGVRVAPDRVVLDYVVDKAEIPTFQDAQGFDTDGSGAADAVRGPGLGPLAVRRLPRPAQPSWPTAVPSRCR